MAERERTTNSGEEATNAPRDIGLDPAAEFRTLSKRLDDLTSEVGRIGKPPPFRLADIITLATVVVGLVIAGFTALGLRDRIDDLVKAQIATETRILTQLNAAESRLGVRIDRVEDRVAKMGERTATLEGQRARAAPALP